MSPGKTGKNGGEMGFWQHLAELRRRILWAAAFVFVGFMGCWPLADKLSTFLARPVQDLLPTGTRLAFTSLTEPFMMYVKVSFTAGIFAASPFVFWQLWLFVAPALTRRERRLVWPFLVGTTFFFVLGGLFAFKVVFPLACRFFLSLGEPFTPVITLDAYFTLALRLLLGIALVFELPVLMFLLSRLGILSPAFLRRTFKYAVLLIFVVAAVITPTPDMVTQMVFAGPMIVLYLLGMCASTLAWRRRNVRRQEEDAPNQ